MHRQAILVQDIGQLRSMLDPVICSVLEPFIYVGLTLEGALEWIIKEELWKAYQFPIDNHFPKQTPHREFYNLVKSKMELPTLEQVVQHFVRVPKLYGDNLAVVVVKGRNLYIHYYINQQLQFPS